MRLLMHTVQKKIVNQCIDSSPLSFFLERFFLTSNERAFLRFFNKDEF